MGEVKSAREAAGCWCRSHLAPGCPAMTVPFFLPFLDDPESPDMCPFLPVWGPLGTYIVLKPPPPRPCALQASRQYRLVLGQPRGAIETQKALCSRPFFPLQGHKKILARLRNYQRKAWGSWPGKSSPLRSAVSGRMRSAFFLHPQGLQLAASTTPRRYFCGVPSTSPHEHQSAKNSSSQRWGI